MTHHRGHVFHAVFLVACVIACSEEESASDPEGAGGASADGGSGGGTGSGGRTGAGGGTSGGGGRASSGGTAASAGGRAAGGTSAGGSASDASTPAVDGATSPPAQRSAGCGLSPQTGGTLTFPFEGQDAEYVLSIPGTYDPSVAYPLGFAFHGRNRTGPNCHDGDCIGFQSVMEDHAILVYMTSLGGTGWEGDGERELNVRYFTALRAHLESTLCVDPGRVFVAGTSSGAHFVNVLGCRFGDRLVAAVPVAGYLPERDCVGQVPALVIHGVDDGSFQAGQEARDFYVGRNGCTTTTVPPLADAHGRVVATRESHECVTYQGCDADKPVVWCEHSEGGYDGSTHGWPAFGGAQIWEFVSAQAPATPGGG